MEVEGLVVVVVALHGEGVGHDDGHPGDELDGLPQLVGQGHIVGVVVIGVQSQHRAGQLVHHVGTGGLDDHVLGEHMGQGVVVAEHLLEGGQLLPGGQGAEQEQIGGLLKAEPVLPHEAVHQLLHIDAPVDQLAGGGEALPVLEVVAQHVADLGHARHDAGAVGVAETPLHPIALVIRRVNLVMFAIFLT